jgi:hypothetical protein
MGDRGQEVSLLELKRPAHYGIAGRFLQWLIA